MNLIRITSETHAYGYLAIVLLTLCDRTGT